jgi:putative ABC transport system permease protein
MNRIALALLVGDRAKYIALVIGLSFATLLLTQQASIFFGLLLRSTGPLQNIGQADLWVADRDLFFVGAVRQMDRDVLDRVRSARGVRWAEPLFVSRAIVDLPDGSFRDVQIIGVDRTTMVGRPPEIVEGELTDLRIPDAVMIQESARTLLGDPEIGEQIILNDRRALVVGFCRLQPGLQSDAVIYATFQNALQFVPLGRNKLSYVLVGTDPGADPKKVGERIGEDPRVVAFTPSELRWASIRYIIQQTGIGVNFGITVLLGLIIGLVVSAAILHQFVTDHLRHFATMKAMGASNVMLARMLLVQVLFAGAIGYGVGVGAAGAFSFVGRRPGAQLDIFFPWPLVAGAAVVMLFVVSLSGLLSMWKVMKLEPAVVFR